MNKLLLIAVAIASVGLTACGEFKGDKGDPGVNAPVPMPTPPPVIDEVQTDIDAMVAQKNADRALLAQAPLTNGLSCTVQEVTGGGQCLIWNASYTNGCTSSGNLLSTSGATTYTYLYKGSFNQQNSSGAAVNELLPAPLRPIFQGKNFKIVCTGQIVVTESNYYNFSLNSDDGSLLYVNGGLIINNDNNHAMTLRNGTALLYRGVQSFQVQYAQTGGGNFGLVLQAGGATIDPRYYFH